MSLYYKPGHRLYQLAFVADLDQEPLSKLFQLLEARNIHILHCNVFGVRSSAARFSVFLDCMDYGVKLEGLRAILDEADFIRELNVAGGEDFVFDNIYFPIVTTSGDRTLLFSRDSFQKMISTMNEMYGTGGELISFQEGMATAARMTRAMLTVFKQEPDAFIRAAIRQYNATGVGQCELVSADYAKLAFTFRMWHNIECEGLKTKKPNSQFVRGHLCGGAATVLKVPMKCIETKCVAVGDPYCQFEVSKQA